VNEIENCFRIKKYKDLDIIWAKSAFKHDFSKKKIEWLLRRVVDTKASEDSSDVIWALSFDEKALPILIIYERIRDNLIRVFHCKELKNINNWE
jgi:hypothetical protein